MNLDPLVKILPRYSKLKSYEAPLKEAFSYADISTPQRMALFLANCAHETAGFTVFEENLYYSAAGLAKTWPKRFKGKDGQPTALAYQIEKKPALIANTVYANRGGNGDFASSHGYIYRGRGLAMLTFYSNYKEVDDAFNLNGKLVSLPDMLLQPFWSACSAGHFWKSRNMNTYADHKQLKAARTVWQGGSLGLQEVVTYYNKFLPILESL